MSLPTTCEAVAFAQERLSVIREEAWPLLLRHWDEIALNKATIPLDPDWETYELLERSGTFHVTTARVAGELIGYVSWLLARNLHYRTVIVAQDDISTWPRSIAAGEMACCYLGRPIAP